MTYTREEIQQHRLEWVEALESGEYTQTNEQLRRGSGNFTMMCCLGVACDLSGVGEWDKYGFYGCGVEESALDCEGQDRESLLLPRAVQEWLGGA